MAKRKLIKRLVDEIDHDDPEDEENLPLEYYELKELAKTRVLLKGSLKVHAIIYLFINVFIAIINLFAVSTPANFGFYDLWCIWAILGWGLILWAHAAIVLTINIMNLEQRIFSITISIGGYILGFLVYVNYYVNHITESSMIWWPWVTVGGILIAAAYAYIVFENDDTSKMERRIGIEIEKMKMEEKLKQGKLEAKKERKEKNIDKED
ncbi:hypothetical protein NEF87_002908 [Candidatus Lokiarchaeum ossiferum]|uniref:2TM domain-containing protein n=1 Tax=Candidatus Lokiarchaeum ossiferum TaxID=2951803 RepID=A0ABY6HTE4_9ARCH|nr:hypothetical protein NEF87_002908 [Candidatus Lokiarchaeum sp. B-35]